MRRLYVSSVILILCSTLLFATEARVSYQDFSYDEDSISVSDSGLYWHDYNGIIKAGFYIEKSNYYNIEVLYYPLAGKNDNIELSLQIDSSDLLGFFSLPRLYSYGNIRKDKDGNDIRALAVIDSSLNKEILRKKDSSSNDSYSVFLNEGYHELIVSGERTGFILLEIAFVPVQEASIREKMANPSGDALIHIEAENISRTSNTTVTSQYDRSSSSTIPSDPKHLLLNIAGGSNWTKDGDFILWDFNVEKAGFYQIGVKYRQNIRKGLSSYRRIYIDDSVPLESCRLAAFPYSEAWTLKELDGYIYLKEGFHTIKMEIVPGSYISILNDIHGILGRLNDIYKRIIMITSTNPDANREYNIDREIPDLVDEFSSIERDLEDCEDDLNLISSGDMPYSAISALINQLDSFIENPETIPNRLSIFKGNITGLSSWIYSIEEQPLDLDWIELKQSEALFSDCKNSFLSNLSYSFLSLLYSFGNTEKSNKEVLTVWVQAGRDQMQTVKELVDEFFMPQTQIDVDVQLVQTGIEQAILAGNGPDVVLFMPYTVPVTLAMRDALMPLSQWNDFTSTVESYTDAKSLIPYEYNGEYYALPLTESFPVLFYRTDILDELGLLPPQSWDEMKMAIPVIQRNNMEVGIPSAWTTYITLLMQKGGHLYAPDKTCTGLSDTNAYVAFKDYARYFTDYSLPLSFDFFNRFRSGEMPIAIADYIEWGRLSYAAKEISGLYGIAPIPSTEGNNKVAATNAQCAVMLNDSNMKDEAWTFLKWFTSVSIQTEYGLRIESSMGPAGRYQSVSDEVLSNLPWLSSELAIILYEKRNVYPIEQVPGSYYTQRNITSAFRNVVISGENEREMLDKYAAIIDMELERKRNDVNKGGLK